MEIRIGKEAPPQRLDGSWFVSRCAFAEAGQDGTVLDFLLGGIIPGRSRWACEDTELGALMELKLGCIDF
jgi:hypothetical protein